MKRQRISPLWRLQALQRWLSGPAPADDARLIHRGRDLAVAWLPGSSTRLVLVFISLLPGVWKPSRLEFLSIASDQGRNHVLFITDRERSWYSVPGQRDRIAGVVRRFVAEHGIETIWSMGNSIGGYGAILFCDRLPISRVVAFVPQILMTDAVLGRPNWAKHLARIRNTVERDLTPIMAAAACDFRVVTGDMDQDDPIHFGHLRERLSDAGNVRIVIVPGQKHEVAKWLKGHGQLTRLVSALWADDRQALEDCSKALPQPLDLTLA